MLAGFDKESAAGFPPGESAAGRRAAVRETDGQPARASSVARNRHAALLALASLLHVAATLAVHLIGRFQLFPAAVDPNGIVKISDAKLYQVFVVKLAGVLTSQGPYAWASAPYPLHAKLYSLSYAAFGGAPGFTALAVEPLNLLLYLTILTLVFKIGREVSGERAATIAASAVALWPTLLFHTTQLLRDPLFIAALLTLVFVNVLWITKRLSAGAAAVNCAAGVLVCALLWLTRFKMWPLVCAVVLLGTILPVSGQFVKRRFHSGNLLGASLLLVMALSFPLTAGRFLQPDFVMAPPELNPAASASTVHLTGLQAYGLMQTEGGAADSSLSSRIVMQAQASRETFAEYRRAGSRMEPGTQVNSTSSLLRALPRAAAVGLFAPFPGTWFSAGSTVGRNVRILSGIETLFMYCVEALALLALWAARKRLSVWVLFLTALAGLTALGLAVTNAGALYRIRYGFFILLVILGAEGALIARRAWATKGVAEAAGLALGSDGAALN